MTRFSAKSRHSNSQRRQTERTCVTCLLGRLKKIRRHVIGIPGTATNQSRAITTEEFEENGPTEATLQSAPSLSKSDQKERERERRIKLEANRLRARPMLTGSRKRRKEKEPVATEANVPHR